MLLRFDATAYHPLSPDGVWMIGVHSMGSPSATLEELRDYRDRVVQTVAAVEVQVEAFERRKLLPAKAVTFRLATPA